MYPIFTIMIILIFIIYFKYINKDVIYVKSDFDDNLYLVRDLEDKQLSANLLAKIKSNIFMVVEELNKYKETKYKEYKKYIEQLTERIQNVIISETDGKSEYTSYSVNKGEQIFFCLRSKLNSEKLHNINILMYVALHEISHVACPEFGHTELFKKIFVFITNTAIEMGIYKKIDFIEKPKEYCGMMIKSSIV